MFLDAKPFRLLVGDEPYAHQRDLPHSRDDGGGISGRRSSPVAGELQWRGQQRHLRGCRLCTGFTCKSGTTDETNTCQLKEAAAADYGTLIHRSRHPGNLATLCPSRVQADGLDPAVGSAARSTLGSVRRQQQRIMLQQILELELAGALQVEDSGAVRTADLH